MGERDESTDVRDTVRAGYGRIASGGDAAGCCGPGRPADELAERLGYTREQLAALPDGANLGLSCGNPTALAALEPGQVVLDLGSGGGFDCFLAGPKVGAGGRVIGVDMTPEMLARARANLPAYRERTGLDNVEFRLGEIEHLPVADASVDVVLSNCVINLSADKPRVWREVARVLRPGGRVAVTDIALLRPLPDALRTMVEALVGCVAGAVPLDAYRATVEAAGLSDVALAPQPGAVEALAQSGDPLFERIRAALPPDARLSDYATGVEVEARRREPPAPSG